MGARLGALEVSCVCVCSLHACVRACVYGTGGMPGASGGA